MQEDWIEHRRGMDSERIGWIMPIDGGFIAIDLLGRHRTEIVDWQTAEETLEQLGIAYLAEVYELRTHDNEWQRVRITEVNLNQIHLKNDDGGAIGGPQTRYTLHLPIDNQLRLATPR